MLLERLRDRYEAGKYLFLSGVRDRKYSAAIELYLARNAGTPIEQMISRLPASVRRFGLGHLPELVKQDLIVRGADRTWIERRGRIQCAVSGGGSLPMTTIVALAVIAAVLAFLVVAMCVGTTTIGRWLLSAVGA